MKVLIAIDSFKGSISSLNGSSAIAQGVMDVFPHAKITQIPLADGGEGTVEALVHATGGEFIYTEVSGPLKDKVLATYGILGDKKTAVIEVAEACGLPLVPINLRNPSLTTTYGVGELIKDAVNRGCREFIIGLGGSATNDAGVGMLQALGFRFYNEIGEEVATGGKVLAEIVSISSEYVVEELKNCTFNIACDVDNVFHGKNGAAYVYGPQKGGTEEMVGELDKGLELFASLLLKEYSIDVQSLKGSGAAGGLGAAFTVFLQGKLQSGIELVLKTIRLEKYMDAVDYIVTGEGMLDHQTSMGKAPSGVANIANALRIPVIALAGGIKTDSFPEDNLGMTACFSIMNAPMSLEKAMDTKVTVDNLRFTSKQIFRLIKAGQGGSQ